MVNPNKLLLTYREASDLLGISLRSLSRAVKRGELMPVQAPGTHGRSGLRFLTREITTFVNQLGQQSKHCRPMESKGKPNNPHRRIGDTVSAVLGSIGAINSTKSE